MNNEEFNNLSDQIAFSSSVGSGHIVLNFNELEDKIISLRTLLESVYETSGFKFDEESVKQGDEFYIHFDVSRKRIIQKEEMRKMLCKD